MKKQPKVIIALKGKKAAGHRRAALAAVTNTSDWDNHGNVFSTISSRATLIQERAENISDAMLEIVKSLQHIDTDHLDSMDVKQAQKSVAAGLKALTFMKKLEGMVKQASGLTEAFVDKLEVN